MATQPRRAVNFTQAAVYTIVVLAILVAVNYVANKNNKTYDSTATKRYTLSDQSAKIAREAQQDIQITYWDRPEAFPNARGLLARYQQLSSRVKVEYKDIDKNNLEAMAAKIEAPGSIQVQVGNKTEIAKGLTEEEVTGAMVRALKGGDRTVCFTTGYGEADAADPERTGISGLKQLTDQASYRSKPVPLLPTPDIPKDCTILVVAGPTRDYLQAAVDAVKAYVEGGGRVLFLLDPPIKFGRMIDDNTALVALIESWGVKLNKDIVLDLSPVGQAFGMGPQLVVVTGYAQHAIVRDMARVATAFPLARSLTTTTPDMTPLFSSSPDSLAMTDLSSTQVNLRQGTEAPRELAAAGNVMTPAGQSRIVVVGNSLWVGNQFLQFDGNRDLYLNMLAWLAQDEELISIRPKDPEDRRLNMNARQVSLLFWGSVVGLPALFVVAGIAVYWRRR